MYKFSAMTLRMKHIYRWGLMRNTRQESLAEHAADTAIIAHLLAELAKNRFAQTVRPELVATAALYHDCSEIITGDLPTPVKYRAASFTGEYKKLEREADDTLLSLLPPEIKDGVKDALTGDALNDREKRIVKAADKLSALIKCIDEERLGNTEFRSAKNTLQKAVADMRLEEADCFVEEFLPAHYLDLDELVEKGD